MSTKYSLTVREILSRPLRLRILPIRQHPSAEPYVDLLDSELREAKPSGSGGLFATYEADAFTGLDYAVNRWYVVGMGRFGSADPYQASAGPGDPGSWNRYSYVGGDPNNWYDPSGLLQQAPGDDSGECITVNGVPGPGCDGGLTNTLPEQNAPVPKCEDNFTPAQLRYVSSNFNSALGLSIATNLAMNADFILAWAAVESSFGNSHIAHDNHNFFGDRDCRYNQATQSCIPNTYSSHKGPWLGAMPCGVAGSGSPNLGFACFAAVDDDGFFQSGYAAIFSHKGRDVTIANGMPNATLGQLAQAIANGGHCTEGNCLNGGYGKQVQSAYNSLLPIIQCLEPWYKP